MKTLDNRHWTNGGTGLTNFQPDAEWQYTAAIEKHGDEQYQIHPLPKEPSNHNHGGMKSLHFLGDLKGEGAGPFWKTFFSLSKS